MSDKPHRPVSEIQQEYANLCARAGNIQYQVYALSQDLELVNKTLKDLNLEGAASQAASPKLEAVPSTGESK